MTYTSYQQQSPANDQASRVADRIAKVKALYHGATTPGERQAAQQALERLLATAPAAGCTPPPTPLQWRESSLHWWSSKGNSGPSPSRPQRQRLPLPNANAPWAAWYHAFAKSQVYTTSTNNDQPSLFFPDGDLEAMNDLEAMDRLLLTLLPISDVAALHQAVMALSSADAHRQPPRRKVMLSRLQKTISLLTKVVTWGATGPWQGWPTDPILARLKDRAVQANVCYW